jgi:hypothetical protein
VKDAVYWGLTTGIPKEPSHQKTQKRLESGEFQA